MQVPAEVPSMLKPKNPRRRRRATHKAAEASSAAVASPSENPFPKDLRTSQEVATELRRRTIAATQALLAAFEAANALDDVDERALRLGDCAAAAARGSNELRNLFFRILDNWGKHPDLDEVIWVGGLLAGCQACALFAAMQREFIEEGCATWIEGGGHLVGLEWCAKASARAFGRLGSQVTSDEGKQAQYLEEGVGDEREFAVLALRGVAGELLDLGIDGIGDDEVAWLHRLADRIDAMR